MPTTASPAPQAHTHAAERQVDETTSRPLILAILDSCAPPRRPRAAPASPPVPPSRPEDKAARRSLPRESPYLWPAPRRSAPASQEAASAVSAVPRLF